MKDKLNQFVSNLNGQFVEVSDKRNVYQCMDLAYLWVFALGIPKTTVQRLYAYEVFTKANDFTREHFDVIPNEKDTIPQDGDLAIFKGGKAGHIAIALGGGTTSKFIRFEQNKPLGTNAHIQEGTYYNILGFLRPKNVIIDSIPQWLKTLLQERSLIIENESEIRTLFDKAKKYDDEIKVSQEQAKSANEQLADKALEVAGFIGKNQLLTSKIEELNQLYNDAKKERDTFSGENNIFQTKNKTLVEEVDRLKGRVGVLKDNYKALKTELVQSQACILSNMTKFDVLKFIFNKLIGR